MYKDNNTNIYEQVSTYLVVPTAVVQVVVVAVIIPAVAVVVDAVFVVVCNVVK